VNNSGVYEFGPIESVTEENFHKIFNINVLGAILVTQAAVKHLGEGGSIINIGSGVSRLTPANSAVYTGSKGALDAITGVLARELAPRKIRVNTINPGGGRYRRYPSRRFHRIGIREAAYRASTAWADRQGLVTSRPSRCFWPQTSRGGLPASSFWLPAESDNSWGEASLPVLFRAPRPTMHGGKPPHSKICAWYVCVLRPLRMVADDRSVEPARGLPAGRQAGVTLAHAGDYYGDVVGLFGGASPLFGGGDQVFGDALRGHAALAEDFLFQAVLAEFFTVDIFGFG
jgi:hypothetical protein